MLRGNKWRVHGVVLTAALAIGSGVAAAAPAFATDNMDCNWLGFNCRAFWDHGYGSFNVWSNYKHLDNKHAASSFGNTPEGVRRKSDSGCKPASSWANSKLEGVTSKREVYYRSC